MRIGILWYDLAGMMANEMMADRNLMRLGAYSAGCLLDHLFRWSAGVYEDAVAGVDRAGRSREAESPDWEGIQSGGYR